MNIKQNNIFRLWLVFSFCISALPGCGNLQLESIRRDREIIIDGKYSDWGKAEAYYDEKEKLVVSLCNDQDYLYICLISRNRKIETQLMESGFVVWFDPDGGKNKSFGIRFPIGMKSMGMSITENDKKIREYGGEGDIEDPAGRENDRWTDKDFEKKLETLEGLQEKIEIVRKDAGQDIVKGKGKPHRGAKDKGTELSLEESSKLGIEAKMGHENGYFVYELKVPLIKSTKHPYAVELRTDKTTGLGLEVQKAIMMDRGMDNPIPQGGGRMPGGSEMPERFQLWATVTLS